MPTKAFFEQYPPFPDNLPVLSLPRLSYQKLLANDPSESESLWDAARNHGFFLLDLSTAEGGMHLIEDVAETFGIGNDFFNLPLDEKKKYKLMPGNVGYKPMGAMKLPNGKVDLTEICGVSRDSICGAEDARTPRPFRERRAFLHTIVERLDPVAKTVLHQLARFMDVSKETVDGLHDTSRPSATILRFLHTVPQNDHSQRQQSLLGHTDSGSVTVLFGALGGLQVLPADAEDKEENWRWVKPEPNCAVINLGDPMVQWTGGLLRSGFHRVFYAPGEQSSYERYSFGYFLKPHNEAPMRRLQEGDVIPKLVGDEKERDARMDVYIPWHANKNKSVMNGINPTSRGGLKAAGDSETNVVSQPIRVKC